MALRVVVEEREYAVAARVEALDEDGEEVPRSDRIAAAIRLKWAAERLGSKPPSIVTEDGHVEAIVELGDAPDRDFEQAAGILLEASSW